MITIARMLPSKFVSLLSVDKSFDRVWFLNIWSTEPKKGLLASWCSGEGCSRVSLQSKRGYISNTRVLRFLCQVFQRAWATTAWKSSSSQLMAWCPCTICTSGRWQWTKWSSLSMLLQVSEWALEAPQARFSPYSENSVIFLPFRAALTYLLSVKTTVKCVALASTSENQPTYQCCHSNKDPNGILWADCIG